MQLSTNKSHFLVLSAGILLSALLACQPVVHSTSPDANSQTACQPGQWFCDDGMAKHCGELGYVIERVECFEPQRCVEGACSDAPDAGWPDNWQPDTRPNDAGHSDAGHNDTGLSDTSYPDSGMADILMPDHFSWPDFGFPDLSPGDAGLSDNALPDTGQADNNTFDANVDAGYNCQAIDDNFEENDQRTSAALLNFDGSNTASYTNLIACDSDDWYVIHLGPASAIKISLTSDNSDKPTVQSGQSDLDLYIYADQNQQADDSSSMLNNPEVVNYYGEAQQIYIHVLNYSYPHLVGEYHLDIEVLPPAVCGDGEVNGDELCDTAIASDQWGSCPTSCSNSGCVIKSLINGGTCDAHCIGTSRISSCSGDDDCCPSTCSGLNDNDCSSSWTPCQSDGECAADQYCDLNRDLPVCKSGCRFSSPSGCDVGYECNTYRQCIFPCESNADCEANHYCDLALEQPRCKSGTPCESNTDCEANDYCDLTRNQALCESGCRLNSPDACEADHECGQDHRCVLSNIVEHERCAPCSESNPCHEGLNCDSVYGQCTPSCGTSDACSWMGCFLTDACIMDDCP